MHFTKHQIREMEKIKRVNLVNSITGIKPANLIGSISKTGQTNLAIFSSVMHLGSNPALLGFIMRPTENVRRDTLENILSTGCYTINHVHESFIAQAHYTAAKFDQAVSEFEQCNLTEQYLYDFKAPFVQESKIKIGMKFLELIPIPINKTKLIIGEIEHLILPETSMDTRGHLNLATTKDVGISGLNSYYALEKIAQFPFARPNDLPDFEKIEG